MNEWNVPIPLIDFLFHYRAPIDDDIIVVDVQFEDAAANFLPNQLFHFLGAAGTAA